MSGELTREYMESLLKAHIDPLRDDIKEIKMDSMEQRREAAACRTRSDNQFAALYKQDRDLRDDNKELNTRVTVIEDRGVQQEKSANKIIALSVAAATFLGFLLNRIWSSIAGG